MRGITFPFPIIHDTFDGSFKLGQTSKTTESEFLSDNASKIGQSVITLAGTSQSLQLLSAYLSPILHLFLQPFLMSKLTSLLSLLCFHKSLLSSSLHTRTRILTTNCSLTNQVLKNPFHNFNINIYIEIFFYITVISDSIVRSR